MAYPHPPLIHAEHGTGTCSVVEIADNGKPTARFEGVGFFPFTFIYVIVDSATAVPLGFPTFTAPTIDMRT